MSITKKKKHVSKKNKKAWRKHCDIRDVEEFLDDQRLEERLGKFDTKPDSELFIVDTGGEEVKTEDEVKPVSERPLTAKQKKRLQLPQTPKCFEILLSSSKVQDPNSKRNHVNPVGSKPTALSRVTDKRRFEKGVYKKKVETARNNRRLASENKKKLKQARQTFDKDIWDANAPSCKGIPESLCEEFVSEEAQCHNVPASRRLRAPPPAPDRVRARAALPAPHPGVSYNPSYQEHQNLLQDVVKHETKMIKREAHLHRVTTGMFSKVSIQEKENQWREEMSEGLPKPHNPALEKSDSETEEYKAINPPVRNKKKDHKTRRKQKERLLEKERLKREKIDKKKITDIYKLRKLQLSISKKEKVDRDTRNIRATKRAETAAVAAPALNAHRPPAAEPVFVPPEALSGDLRQINCNGNPLRDRYESLQHRGVIAASKLMMKKKRKLKSYFKPGHKVTEQDIQRYVDMAKKKP